VNPASLAPGTCDAAASAAARSSRPVFIDDDRVFIDFERPRRLRGLRVKAGR